MLDQQRRRMFPAREPRRNAKTEPSPDSGRVPDAAETVPCAPPGVDMAERWRAFTEGLSPDEAGRLFARGVAPTTVLRFCGAAVSAIGHEDMG